MTPLGSLAVVGAFLLVALAAVVATASGASTLRALVAARARVDFPTFVQLVGRDERTGARIRLTAAQQRMVRLWLAHPRSVTFAHPEFGKTSLLVLYTLWTLGRDPSTRIVIASGTAGQAEKILRAVASYVETSTDLAAVFPALKPGRVWRSDALVVAGAPATLKDPNVSTAAPGSGAVLGLRCDVLFLDDLLTRENTRSPAQREELHRWVVSTLLSRLAPNAKVIACGTCWHSADELHELARLPGCGSERFPVLDASVSCTRRNFRCYIKYMARRAKMGDSKTAIGYLRVSTEEQRLGPEAQAAALDAWAAREGVRLVAVFLDRGVSGATPIESRPGLCGALATVRDLGAGVVVASKRDRVARKEGLASMVADMFRSAGATLRTADGASDGADDDEGAFVRRSVEDMVATLERMKIRARTKAALAVKKARGERTGSVPFGYRLAADGVRIEPEEREQSTIARARALRSTGLSLRAVALALTAERRVGRTGERLNHTQVVRMLRAYDAAQGT